ncbi:MAG: hypothetical protein ABEH43_11560 [Flavobacteriales bacterium]
MEEAILEKASEVFEEAGEKEDKKEDLDKLYAKIGRLELEKEFLKKNLDHLD